MKQYEAVIQTLERLGGIATLGQLNQEVFKIKDCEWKTKTPFASIRRIVQENENRYYRMRLNRQRSTHTRILKKQRSGNKIFL